MRHSILPRSPPSARDSCFRRARPRTADYRYDRLKALKSSRGNTLPRILIVDDYVAAGMMLTLLLRAKGYVCELCAVATDALKVVDSFSPAVILLDIAMPGLNGLALARLIRSRADGAKYVLLGLSGYGRCEDQERAIEAGMDAYHVKPTDLDQLLASVPGLVAAKSWVRAGESLPLGPSHSSESREVRSCRRQVGGLDERLRV